MESDEEQLLLELSDRTSKLTSLKEICKVIYSTMIACFGALQFGYAVVFSSPLIGNLNHLSEERNFTLWQEGFGPCTYKELIGPMTPIGAIIGSLLGSVVVAFTGLVTGMVIPVFFSILGWAMMGGSYAVTEGVTFRAMVLCGRFFTGLAAGWQAGIVPAYIAEISPSSMRGKLGILFEMLTTLGIMISYLLGALLDYWIVAWIFTVFSGLHIILLFTLKESPLRSRNVLKNVQSIFHSKSTLNETEKKQNCCKPQYLWRLILVAVIMTFQQITGVNAIAFYAGSILSSANVGTKSVSADTIASLCIGVVQFIATTFCSIFVIDRFGRRILLFFGSLGLMLSMLAFTVFYGIVLEGLVYHTEIPTNSSSCDLIPAIKNEELGSRLSSLPIASIMVFFIFFSISWGPIPWVILGEIFPKEIRALGGGIGSASMWLSLIAVTLIFPIVSIEIGETVPFLVFSMTCFLLALFVIFFIPETKGLTLEESSSLKFNISTNVKEFFLLMKDCVKCRWIACKCQSNSNDTQLSVVNSAEESANSI